MSNSNPKFSREQIMFLERVFPDITIDATKKILGVEEIYFAAGIKKLMDFIRANEGYELRRPRD